MRDRERDVQLTQRFQNSPFMLSVCERKQQRDRDRFGFAFTDLPKQARHLVIGERLDYFARRRDAFGNAISQIAGDERRRLDRVQVVKFRSSLAADFDDVFKARRRHQRDARAATLQQRVGSDGSAVNDFNSGDRRSMLFDDSP